MIRILRALACCAVLFPLALFSAEEAKIGDVTIKVPAPSGFVRYDGLNERIDGVMLQMVPKTNRLLLMFATPKDAALAKKGKPEELGRYMMLQTFRAAEDMKLSAKEFGQVVEGVEAQFASSEKAEQLQDEVNAQLKKTKDAKDLKVGETVMLGVYQKTEYSVDMGMLIKAQVRNEEPTPMAAAFSIIRLREKVLYLYVYSGYYAAEDIAWTRKTVKEWREAVVAANRE
jgi:hypothetical protein